MSKLLRPQVISERRMHTKGLGTHGSFTVTQGISRYSAALLLLQVRSISTKGSGLLRNPLPMSRNELVSEIHDRRKHTHICRLGLIRQTGDCAADRVLARGRDVRRPYQYGRRRHVGRGKH
jgi:hypothetical protein